MAVKGERDFFGGNARAVVNNADKLNAASPNLHRYLRGPGVNRVLDQFLDYGDRPLDNFPGRDPGCKGRRQNPDRHNETPSP